MITYTVKNGAAVLQFNTPPLNILSDGMLEALTAAVSRANEDTAVHGIVLTGGNSHFSAGADVNLFKALSTTEEAVAVSRRFQEAFSALEASAKPVVAAIAGLVMGGALECALSAHYRVCTTTTRCSLPEVNLGILPGAGGTQRLPRCIGPEAALKMMLSGKPASAQEAYSLGLVDAVCEPDTLVDEALKLLRTTPEPKRLSQRTDTISDATINDSAFSMARKLIAKNHPELIAPAVILDAVSSGITLSFEAGCEKERSGFARCMSTTATQNKIHNFFATRSIGRSPRLKSCTPESITTTAVIGMGSMGSGIAQAIATAGKQVIVMDADTATAEKGVARIAASFDRKINRGSLTQEKADAIIDRITVANNWTDIASVDMVIEAVFEDIAVKRSILNKIADTCSAATIVATNTSTINLDILAENLPHSERLVGLHFFNPAHSMPLVEVITRDESDKNIVATTIAFARELRKSPILVNNSVGFVVNRLFIPYCIEAYQLLEEGADPFEIDAAMVEFGFAMGPLAIIDMTGIDILALTNRQMLQAFPFHIPLSAIATTLVDENHLGQKTGNGVYHYEKSDRTPRKSDHTEAIIAGVRKRSGIMHAKVDRSSITRRLVMRLVAEAFRVVEEKIAQSEEEVDVAMVLGTGFPDFRGGVCKYARDLGLENVFSQLDSLAASYGKRYQPCNYLHSIIQEKA